MRSVSAPLRLTLSDAGSMISASIISTSYPVRTMAHTTVSSKFQVVIPKEIRERTGLKPGQRLSVIATAGVIHLVPVPSLQELRGIARGADTRGLREKVDRL